MMNKKVDFMLDEVRNLLFSDQFGPSFEYSIEKFITLNPTVNDNSNIFTMKHKDSLSISRRCLLGYVFIDPSYFSVKIHQQVYLFQARSMYSSSEKSEIPEWLLLYHWVVEVLMKKLNQVKNILFPLECLVIVCIIISLNFNNTFLYHDSISSWMPRTDSVFFNISNYRLAFSLLQ